MERLVLRNLFIFGIGVVVGAFAGHKFTKDYYEDLIKEEIDEMKGHYESKIEAYNFILKDMAEPEEKEEVPTPTMDVIKKEAFAEKDYTDYNKIAKSYGNLPTKPSLNDVVKERIPYMEEVGPQDDPAEEDDEEFDEEDILISKEEGIEVISHTSFYEDFKGHEKLSVTYYEGDNTLTDERDGIVPDPLNFIGEEALDNFGNMSDDPNVVYIRNHNNATDFEIVRVSDSYTRVVLGVPAEEPKKEKTPAVKKVRKVKTDGGV